MGNNYKGWDIQWTGWKANPADDTLVGQWIAWKGNKAFYASAPGGDGPYRKYEVFQIAPVGKQVLITSTTPLGVAEYWKNEAFDRLFKLLNEEGSEGG